MNRHIDDHFARCPSASPRNLGRGRGRVKALREDVPRSGASLPAPSYLSRSRWFESILLISGMVQRQTDKLRV